MTGTPEHRVRGPLSTLVDEGVSLIARARHSLRRETFDTEVGLSRYVDLEVETMFPAPARAPSMTEEACWSRRGLTLSKLRFVSPHRALCPDFGARERAEYEANHMVHVHWLRHADGPRPTMVFLPSWMQPWTRWEDRTLLPHLAERLGLDVARISLPYHGERRPARSLFDGEYFWTGDLVRTIEAIRQSVMDVRALVRWLDEQGRGPVGAAGISLGGMMTLLTSCAEPKLAFAAPISAHLDLRAILEDASLLRPMRGELRRIGWSGDDVEDWVRRTGVADLNPVIPRERIFMVAGRYDRFLRPEQVVDLWKRWGLPRIHWYPGGHLGMFRYLRGDLGPMRHFLWSLGLVPDPPDELDQT